MTAVARGGLAGLALAAVLLVPAAAALDERASAPTRSDVTSIAGAVTGAADGGTATGGPGPPIGGPLGGPGAAGEFASSSGCACDAGGNPTPGFVFVFAFVAAAVWARGRKRS